MAAATAAAEQAEASARAVPAAGNPAARAATAAGTPTRGPPTAPADIPTNRRSKTISKYLQTDHPRRGRGSAEEHHDGQATTTQAQEEGLRVLPGAGRLRRLQGHRPAPQVHLRSRQDPCPPGDG